MVSVVVQPMAEPGLMASANQLAVAAEFFLPAITYIVQPESLHSILDMPCQGFPLVMEWSLSSNFRLDNPDICSVNSFVRIVASTWSTLSCSLMMSKFPTLHWLKLLAASFSRSQKMESVLETRQLLLYNCVACACDSTCTNNYYYCFRKH